MAHILATTPAVLTPEIGLPRGGMHWKLDCALLPDWITRLPQASGIRAKMEHDVKRALQSLPDVSHVVVDIFADEISISFITPPCKEVCDATVSETSPGQGTLRLEFSTPHELPLDIRETVEAILDREVYSTTEPITGNGNDT